MSLIKDEDIKKVWGSHLPLLKAVMEVLKPKTAVECGSGNYSTPILSAGCGPGFTSIEHDPAWANRMRRAWPDVRILCDEIPLCERRYLKRGQLEQVEVLYATYAAMMTSFDLLFVDTVACARVPAFNSLGPLAAWIIVHDTGAGSWEHYNYNLLNAQGLAHYQLCPAGNVNGHGIEWTSLYSRKPVPYDALRAVIDTEAWALWGFTARWERVA